MECHKAPYEKNGMMKQPKAGLRLDGAAYIMHGSDDGAVVMSSIIQVKVLFISE